MGTRSTYRVMEKGTYEGKAWKKIICLLYLQYDGYPDGHPLDTMQWLATGEVVNGIQMEHKGLIFNGAGCLAAQLVAKHKEGPGGAYLYPVKSRCRCDEDYVYDIIVDFDKKAIEVVAYDNMTGWGDKDKVKTKVLYRGTPAGYVEWVKNRKD